MARCIPVKLYWCSKVHTSSRCTGGVQGVARCMPVRGVLVWQGAYQGLLLVWQGPHRCEVYSCGKVHDYQCEVY